jgi:hypothetical protein
MNRRGASPWPTLLAVLGIVLGVGMLLMGQLIFAIPVLLIAPVVGIGALFSRRTPPTA